MLLIICVTQSVLRLMSEPVTNLSTFESKEQGSTTNPPKMIDPELKDRVVLVTGASAGIGAAIAREFARFGAKIAIHYLDAQTTSATDAEILHTTDGLEGAVKVRREILAAGGVAEVFPANLIEPVQAAALFRAVEEALGPVDILVNNAAHCEGHDTISEIDADIIDRHFKVNARAPVLLIREFAGRTNARGASVINISTNGARAFAGQIAYGASKAALEAFTRSLAIELGPKGIRVNTIAPGPVQTGWITSDLEQQVLPDIPLRRLGSPADIANAAIFLGSNQSSWITGQIIQVAGGHLL